MTPRAIASAAEHGRDVRRRFATRFAPGRDGLDCPSEWVDGMTWPAPLLEQAWQDALESLRKDFSGMVDYYQLPRRLRCWCEDARPGAWRSTAAAVGAVDYFLARRTPPRGNECQALRAFLQERLLQAFAAGSTRLVQWRGILHGIPEEWLPCELLRRNLLQRLAPDHRHVFHDLHLMLQLPTPGGKAWLKKESRREWLKVREHLAAGRPCVVELVRGQLPTDFMQRDTVVVFAGEERDVDLLVLHYCHPARGAKPQSLQVDFSAGGLVVGENVQDQEGAVPVGFFLVECPPALPPQPRGWNPLHWRGLARVWWWWRHRRRHL